MTDSPPRPRRRWLRRVVILVVVLGILIALAPTLATPFVRSKIVAALEERTGADVSLDTFSLGWPGRATLGGLRLVAPDGIEHARVDRAVARVDVLAALGGSIDARVDVDGWAARAQRRQDGSWSLADLAGDGEEPESDASAPTSAEDPGDVRAVVELRSGTLILQNWEQVGELTLERTRLDLDGLDRPAPFEATGTLLADGPTTLAGGTLTLKGAATLAPEGGGGPLVEAGLDVRGEKLQTPADVAAGDFTLRVDARFDGAALALELLSVESNVLTGTLKGRLEGLDGVTVLALRGLDGAFTYVPDVLAPWLAPHLPGELSGTEPERIELHFDGPLDELTAEGLIASAEGRSHLGLGRFTAFGLEATGGVSVEVTGGVLSLGGELAANGGALNLSLGYRPDGASLALSLDGARAGAQLAPLLGELHPAFAGLDQLEGAGLDGLLVGKLELAIDGPVPLSGLADGFDLSRVRGGGSLALDHAVLRGSPFLAELLTSLGEPTETRLDLAPIAFSVDGGRLAYREPWRWSIAGVETFFSGSLSATGTLDLAWEVPITDALVAKHKVLKPLAGGKLRVPLGGTLTDPKLDWDAALEGLAEQALKSRIEKELGLEEVLGGGGDAEAILRGADALWDAGKKAKAAVEYQRLRDDHRLTPTYLLNKKKIDERRRWRPN